MIDGETKWINILDQTSGESSLQVLTPDLLIPGMRFGVTRSLNELIADLISVMPLVGLHADYDDADRVLGESLEGIIKDLFRSKKYPFGGSISHQEIIVLDSDQRLLRFTKSLPSEQTFTFNVLSALQSSAKKDWEGQSQVKATVYPGKLRRPSSKVIDLKIGAVINASDSEIGLDQLMLSKKLGNLPKRSGSSSGFRGPFDIRGYSR